MNIVEPIRDIGKILEVKNILKRKNTRDYLLFELGINTGLRISDILKLKVVDVKNKIHIEIYEQKTKKFKQVFLMKNLRDIIQYYIKDLTNDEFLFKSNNSNMPITRIQAYRIIHINCKIANISGHIGTHTLRKTFGYHFYKRTKDIALLQSIFNHSNPKVTLRYIGLSQDMIDESLQNFYL